MPSKNKLRKPVVILPVLIVVYFLAFPADLVALIGPLTEVLISADGVLTQVLKMSVQVSPWLYVLLSVVVLSRTVTGIWGRKSES